MMKRSAYNASCSIPAWVRETIDVYTTVGASPPGIAHTVVAIYLVLSERSTILVNAQCNHLEFCDWQTW